MSFGRLERTPGPKPMSEINMTPLVDVMLVLVAIFIITAPLLASSIPLDLPTAATAPVAAAPKFVTVAVDQAGQTFLDGKALTLTELATQLAQSAALNPDLEVQLRADTTVPYGRIVDVMSTAQKAGLNRIGFVTDPRLPKAPGAKP